MSEKIKGIKLNMSQIFLDTGKVIPVTVIGKITEDLTAEMENKLDDIAQGKREYKKTLKDFLNSIVENWDTYKI